MNASDFLANLKAASKQVKAFRYGNPSGTLWEKLWIFDGQRFRSKTCASGCFTDWYGHADEASALRVLEEDFALPRD